MLLFGCAALCGCKRAGAGTTAGSSAASAASAAPPVSTVDHGELDTRAPKDSPQIGSLVIAATVYKLPDTGSASRGTVPPSRT